MGVTLVLNLHWRIKHDFDRDYAQAALPVSTFNLLLDLSLN